MQAASNVAQQLHKACNEVGFFYVSMLYQKCSPTPHPTMTWQGNCMHIDEPIVFHIAGG